MIGLTTDPRRAKGRYASYDLNIVVIGHKKIIQVHERLSFPEEGLASPSQIEESDEPSYCHEYVLEEDPQRYPGGLTRL